MGNIKFTKSGQGQQLENELKQKTRELKQEISRKASMANKRLQRLENKNLTNTPAYKNYVEYGGGVKFSVKGKSYNELQSELSRVNHFLNSATSTIRGTNQVLKEMAKTTGMKYDRVGDLYAMTGKFFELASKVEQYLNSAMQGASAIKYQKVWKAINEYIQSEKIDLRNAEVDIDSIISEVTELIKTEYESHALDVIFDTFSQLNIE